MKLERFLKRLIVILIIASCVFGLVFYCSSKIDKNRLEKKEREEKLEAGTCEFDNMDLKNFSIRHNSTTIKPVSDFQAFKKYFDYQFQTRGYTDSDTSAGAKQIQVDNHALDFYQEDKLVFVTSVLFDQASEFTFVMNNEIIFSPDYSFENIKEQYPKSFACRGSTIKRGLIELFYVRIDNADKDSKLKFIVLSFDNAEKLCCVEFAYEGINLN